MEAGALLKFGTNGNADIVNIGTGAIRFKPSSQTLALTLAGANATFAGNILMGNTVVNPASGFADQTGIGLKYSTTVPEIQVSSDDTALQLGRTSTGGNGIIMAMRYASNTIHTFSTNAVSIGTNATFAGNVALQSNAGNATKSLSIYNEGTAANDDAVLGFKTHGSRTYSIGTHRDSGAFLITAAENSVASNELMTMAMNGNTTFAGSLTIPDYIYHTGDSNTYFGFSGADTYVVAAGGTSTLQVGPNVVE